VRIATCPLCEAACGILVDVEGDRIRSVRGDPDDPFSGGYICPKAAALADIHNDRDRLRTPLIRDGGRWREVSWEQALDRAAAGFARVRRQYGRDAVAIYYGNPVAHNLGLMTHAPVFARALRTRNVYSGSSTDQLPQMLVALRMFGHQALIPVPDLEGTDFLLILGANPVVSNGSLMTAPGVRRRLRSIRDRGGRVVVVDPRRTETAEAAGEHVPIRPGTDAWLLAGMLHVMFTEGWVRGGSLERRIRNLDALATLVRDVAPELAASRTGVSAETIRRLASDFAGTERAACYGRVGLCTQRHGTLAVWLVQALNLVTGHMDDVGGMMLTTPAVDVVSILSRMGLRGTYDRWRSRVRNLPEFGGELPVATLADEIQAPGRGRIRALITIAGNPILSTPNGRRLDRALASLEHVVAVDPYLNETTRHAHVVLPPAPPLSRGHYDLALYAFSVRNVAKYSEPVVTRSSSERHDWEILAEVGARLFAPTMLRAAAIRAVPALRPEHVLNLLLRIGPYRLSLAKLRKVPHGVDLGPLEPGRIARSIATPDGNIDIAPADFVSEARNRLLDEAVADTSGQLLLIGRRQLRSHNSWLHNAHRLVKGRPQCTLLVHPIDAATRELATGDSARLESNAGALTVAVEVTETIMPGVVSLPHGWGHDREGTLLTVASRWPGASVNDATSELAVDTLSGTAAFNALAVSIRRVRPTGLDDARDMSTSGEVVIRPTRWPAGDPGSTIPPAPAGALPVRHTRKT
jgi:anaerobic selenocysteine-containing dehydrogenase